MLSKPQRKALRPALEALQQANSAVRDARDRMDLLGERIENHETQRMQLENRIEEKDSAYKTAFLSNSAEAQQIEGELADLRAQLAAVDKGLEILRGQLTEERQADTRVKADASSREITFLRLLHASLCEGFRERVEAFYEGQVAPIWMVEHLAFARHPELRGAGLAIVNGVMRFAKEFPTQHNQAMGGPCPSMAVEFHRFGRSPGIVTEQAEPWLQERIREVVEG